MQRNQNADGVPMTLKAMEVSLEDRVGVMAYLGRALLQRRHLSTAELENLCDGQDGRPLCSAVLERLRDLRHLGWVVEATRLPGRHLWRYDLIVAGTTPAPESDDLDVNLW